MEDRDINWGKDPEKHTIKEAIAIYAIFNAIIFSTINLATGITFTTAILYALGGIAALTVIGIASRDIVDLPLVIDNMIAYIALVGFFIIMSLIHGVIHVVHWIADKRGRSDTENANTDLEEADFGTGGASR